MAGVLKDGWEILRRGWLWMLGGGLVTAVGSAQDAAGLIYSRDGWHLPAWYWLLALPLAYIVAAHLVLKEWRKELAEVQAELESLQARPSGPTFLHMGPGAQMQDSTVSDNQMITTTGAEDFHRPPVLDRESLLDRLTKFARELRDFVFEREAGTPELGRTPLGEGGKREAKSFVSYLNETMALYRSRFKAEAVFLVQELASHAEIPPSLTVYLANPVNPLGLEDLVAELEVAQRRLEAQQRPLEDAP